MTAEIWISGRIAHVIIKDKDGRVIDLNNDWNNRASAESWVYDNYPESIIKFTSRDKIDDIKQLNEEWNRCKEGSG